jgi:hypothetical protein
MTKVATKNRRSLLVHQNAIEKALADFQSGRNTAHLPPEEVDLVIGALRKRLDSINESIASFDSISGPAESDPARSGGSHLPRLSP